jgi:hypothetical protein
MVAGAVESIMLTLKLNLLSSFPLLLAAVAVVWAMYN